jgi:Carboxypeptidase regulatory-like domain
MRISYLLVRAAIVGGIACWPTAAQRVSADFLGHVVDPGGLPVAGTAVKAESEENGLERRTATGTDGEYRITGLTPGRYTITAEQAGFRRMQLRHVELQVGQEAVVDIRLEVGAFEQSLTVEGRADLVDSASTQLSGVVTGSTLRELPLNGRDLFQLTLLEPGVVPTPGGGNPFAEGATSKAAVNGARPTMNNVNLDGSDINDPAYNVPPGGVAGVQLGVEGVQEFRVLLHSYGAEFGRNAGANVQLVTKSGTNDLHGTLFEFHRNAAVDARNFFDLKTVPPFVRNQFGANLGGALHRNRAFYFANYESFRESRSVTASIAVPDANAHAGFLPSNSNPGTLVAVGVNPAIAPFLALYPLPNAGSLGAGVGNYRSAGRQPSRNDYGLIRGDYAAGKNDTLFARYVMDDSDALVPFLSTEVPGFPGIRRARNQYAMVSWQRSLRPNVFNEAKVSYNRVYLLAQASPAGDLSIGLTPKSPLGPLNIDGLASLGNDLVYPVRGASGTSEVIDNLSLQRGRHSWKAGTNFKRLQLNTRGDAFVNGNYVFTDLSPYGFPTASANPALEAFLQGAPFLYIGADSALADTNRGFRQNYLAFYGQDEIRFRRFTLTLGLRWEYWSNPTEVNQRLANIRNLLTDAKPTSGPIWEGVPLDQWSPRVGIAWTPSASGKTVFRGGFALMRDQLWANVYQNVRFYEPHFRALLYVLPQFSNAPPTVNSLVGLGGPPSVIGTFGVTYRPQFPNLLHYNFNLQHELGRDLMVQLAYVGSRGNHLLRNGEANPNLPALGRRLNPNFGSIPQLTTDAQSFYNAAQLKVSKRASHGVQLQASYSFSKLIDDASGYIPTDTASDAGVVQNYYDRKGDRGRSSFDRRHLLIFNALWTLPLARSGGSARKALLADWTIGGITTAISGTPFTGTLGSFNNSLNLASFAGDRPDLRPAARACDASTGNPDRWFDPSIYSLPAVGTYGNAGRNILCGPGLLNADFSLLKTLALWERVKIQFRAEFFNLFNHANFEVPVNTQGPVGSGGAGDAVFIGRRANCDAAKDALGCGVLASDVGRIVRTVTPSRQLQFGLKLTF